MTHLLDTDHVSILQRRSGQEYAILAPRIAQVSPSDLAFSLVSFHEQILGAHTYINQARKPADVVRGYNLLAEIVQSFMGAPLLSFDAAAAVVFENLRAAGVRIPTMDLRIASIALSRNLILLTRNVKDFGQVPGLITEDWTI